ncbi:glycosyltransferase family 2 protein [Kineococcus sp. TBRC 1896]|uniref:Glycosyltransferase family 2 protein n=1 Tax=Kineococcus mangrovi TaxID=1660183 RepID=A0ABV4HZL5_9ACTN
MRSGENVENVENAPEVSVVIPVRNGARTIVQQLDALAAQRTSRRFEVLVADNGSDDGTAGVVQEWARGRAVDVRVIDASHRAGSNVARNAGTAAARAEKVLICDADDEVDPGWLDALAEGLDRADGVGGTLERVKLNDEYIRRWGPPGGQTGIVKQLGYLPRPIGANCGFRRPVWESLGGFNEDYVRGGPETEFYWRLQLAGFSLLDVPGAVVHYRMRAELKASVKQMYIWGRQSPMLYRDFRPRGMTFDARESLDRWVYFLRLVKRSGRGPRDRLEALRQGGYRLGRLVGSVKYRVVFF